MDVSSTTPGVIDVAIVGVACRLPGAHDYRAYWENLVGGRSAIREIPKSRWDVTKYWSSDRDAPNKSISKWCGIVDGVERFDNGFFEVSPREAKSMDPQQRLLLEETLHCIEDSGVSLRDLQHRRTAVFAGVMAIDHHQELVGPQRETDGFAGTGSYVCILANRISYAFGLSGKSFTIDAACASSLVALHEAKASLKRGECDYALVCGVSVNTHPWKYVTWSKARMLSPDGCCKTFDIDANGYVPGDGVGVLLLQRADDAARAKNRVYGIVRGSAVGHGGRARSMTAPRVEAQKDVILRALDDGGVDPRSIGYVEAHGTGTSLGDPIEIEALTQAWRTRTADRQFAKIGSVKTNIGHLEAAAGVAGVIKVLLMMRHGTVPKTLNVERLNPIIDFASSPFEVALTPSAWAVQGSQPRRAAISSFGIGGVNSHVVIEEAPARAETIAGSDGNDGELFLLSAKSNASLKRKTAEWRAVVERGDGPTNLRDVCRTLAVSSGGYAHRRGAVVRSFDDVRRFLDVPVHGAATKVDMPEALVVREPQLTGFGALARLHEGCAPFRARFDALVSDVRDRFELPGLDEELRTAAWSAERAPTLSAIAALALTTALRDLGWTPRRVIGEGGGLPVALACAGLFDATDAVAIAGGVRANGAMRAPSIAFVDPLTQALVHPLALDEARLRATCAAIHLTRAELAQAIESARLLAPRQYTFKHFLEEWNDVLAPFGGVERLLAEAPSFGEDDRRGRLFFCAIADASRRLDDKWSLSRRSVTGGQQLQVLVDLVSAGVVTRAHVAELVLAEGPDFARVVREADVAVSVGSPALARFAPTRDAAWLRDAMRAPLGRVGPGAIECALSSADEPYDGFQRTVLDLWRAGAAMRWDVLHPAGSYAKAALQGYSFEPTVFSARERDAEPAQTSRVVAIADPIVRDHVIGGRHLVPGALMIEVALRAASVRAVRPVNSLTEVVIHAAGVVIDRAEVSADVDGDEVRVRVDGTLTAHAKVARVEPPAIDRAIAEAHDEQPAGPLYEQLARTGYAYGESLRLVRGLWSDGDVTVVSIDAGVAREGAAVVADVLDAVLQAGLLAGFVRKAIAFGDDLFVPTYLGAVAVHDDARGVLRACITNVRRAGNTLSLDARVVDASDVCVLTLRNAVFSRVPRVSSTSLRVPGWSERPVIAPLVASLVAPDDRAIIVAPDDALGACIAIHARETHGSVRVHAAGDDSWIASTSPGATVYFVPTAAASDIDTFDDRPLRRFFECIKALASRAVGPIRVVVPLRDSFAVVAEDGARGFASTAFVGFARTAMLESLHLRISIVDVGGAEPMIAAHAVVAEAKRGEDDLVAYRGGARFVREWRDVVPEVDARGALFEDGKHVVVVGGVGGIGRRIIDELAAPVPCRVTVLGRAAANDARVAHLLAERRACDVAYVSCDVADRARLEAALVEARARFGPIHGVLHLGGVVDDRFLAAKAWDDFRRVLGPKVDGALNLNACTARDPLDYFVAFSSIVGVVGNVGQSDYAAANSFVDGLITFRARAGAAGRSVAVAWPLWEGVGMGAALDASSIDRSRLRPIAAREGMEALGALLSVPSLTHALVEGPLAAASPVPRLAAVETPMASGDLRSHLKAILGAKLGMSPDAIDDRDSLFALGLDSLLLQDVMGALAARWSGLPPTLFFEHPNVASLVAYFEAKGLGVARPAAPTSVVADSASAAHDPIAREPKGYAIAIIGMSGRFPGAANVAEYWRNLAAGKDSVTEIPSARWDHRSNWAPRTHDGATSYGKWGGFLEDVDRFDPLFFQISPKEAEEMDPQQRLFLECVWETMDDAGYGRRDRYRDKSVGLFVGSMWSEYSLLAHDESKRSGRYAGPGSIDWAIANRVSFVMDFKGPSLAVDTACSSSLVAVHLACQSLLAGDCEMAVAGGVNLSIHPDKYVYLSQAKFLSTDGRCRSFGEGGDGYVPGEGVGALLLKPLTAAVADGDAIYGIVRGSATNHGGKATGFTVPSPEAQAEVIARAMERAAIDADAIDYVECHGTGTSLGDPIEARGLAVAFARSGGRRGACPIGSVKSNIGHLEAAAGVAALIKVLLAMRHGTIPRSLHSDTLNAKIDFAETPLRVVRESEPWPAQPGRARIAGVSSFGAGGANAHVIVEAHASRALSEDAPSREAQLVLLSAKDETALDAVVARMRAFLDDEPSVELADIAHTLQVGRESWKHRLAIVALDTRALRAGLDGYLARAPREPKGAGALERAAVAWERGDRIDPAATGRGDARPRIARLPSYPFKRERYWIGASPLARPDGGTIAPTDRWLVDHVVGGTSVLPGARQIELILAEAEPDAVSLANVVWLRPFVAGEHLEIGVDVSGAPGKRRFVVWSRSARGERVEHSQGSIVAREENEARGKIDTVAVESRCRAVRRSRDDCYAAFARAGIVYGPTLRVINELASNDDEALATLSVGDGGLAAVIDGALQTALTLLAFRTAATLHVPLTIGALAVMAPLPESCCVHARRAGGNDDAPTFDIDVADASGGIVLRMRGVVLRRGAHTTEATGEERYYVRGAIARPLAMSISPRSGDLVVFESDALTAADVARATPRDRAPARVIRVRPGRSFRALGDGAYEIDAASPADHRALLRAIGSAGVKADRFVHAWSLRSSSDAGALGDRVAHGYVSVLFLAQALLAERAATGAALLFAYSAGNDDPAYAAVSGLFRTIGREKPDLARAVVGFAEPADDAARLVAQELAAIGTDVAEAVYAQSSRTVPAWHRASPATEVHAPALRAGDVCIVTGGAGGLGLIFSAHLVARYGARVVVTGRSALDPARAEVIAMIGAPGSVIYQRGDVSHRADVEAWVRRARELGPLRGVIHSAGVTRDSYLIKKTRDEIDAVLGAKVHGTSHLDDATRDDALAFFALFSSVSGVFGNAGQSDYAYANAFLDAFARRRDEARGRGERSGKTVSIDWPLWRDGGMQVGPEIEALLERTMGIRPLRRDEGLRAFDAVLNLDGEQVMVVAGNEDKFERLLRVEKPQAPAAEKPSRDLAATIRVETLALMSRILGVRPGDVDVAQDLRDYGFDSITLTRFANVINERFDLEITPAIFFEHATIASLVDHLCAAYTPHLATRFPSVPAIEPARVAPAPLPVSPPAPAPPVSASVPADGDASRVVDVAIVGISGVMPGSHDLAEYWQHLAAGDDLVTDIPQERFAWWARWRNGAADAADVMRGKRGGFVGAPDCFDAAFFGLSPREADFMDPQQRVFLETVWSVVEEAGYRMSDLTTERVGLFVGVATSDYAELMRGERLPIDGLTSTGVFHSILANRISYLFDFTGPSEPVDTACSSSLVAVQRAVDAIRGGQCDVAIAGGVNMLLAPTLFSSFEKGGMLSPDGRCKTFDKAANGYVRGEGSAAVLLKPLHRAIADGDHVYGIVKSAVVGHAGRANSLTAPNAKAQADLLARAYAQAGVTPDRVGLVETHGTGTSLGDPIEVNALKMAFGAMYEKSGASFDGSKTCALGAVKTNIGHLETAAGMAGLTKVLLAMKHRCIPANANFHELNPYIDLDATPFFVPRESREWPAPDGQPRVAGVSSFGFGGVNAHVVLEEYVSKATRRAPPGDERLVFVLSAKTEVALRRQAESMRAYLEAPGAAQAGDVAYTLQVGREAMRFRLAIHGDSARDVAAKLRAYLDGEPVDGVFVGSTAERAGAASVLLDGEEWRVYLRLLTENRRLSKLCQLWTAGVEVDWHLLHAGTTRERVSLPTYSFERERHWYDRHAVVAPPVTPQPPRAGNGVSHGASNGASNGSAKRLQAAERLATAQTPGTNAMQTVPLPAPPAARAAPDLESITRTLRGLLADIVFVDAAEVDETASFVELGLDSMLGVEFVNKINETFVGRAQVKDSDLYGRSNVADLAELLTERVQGIAS